MRKSATVLFLLLAFVFAAVSSARAQSRLIGDQFTFSAGNFPDSFGITYDPVLVPQGEDFFEFESLENDGDEWGGDPVPMTFDGIEEQAGGLLVNERAVPWPGKDGGIFAVQAAGIGDEGETEFDLLDWEVPGEVVEFSYKTADGGYLANEAGDQSFYSIVGLDWANSKEEHPEFFETGFYFYYSKDGVPLTGYETQLPDIGLLVGEHPFDETIPEVTYIGYSRGQVQETTKPYNGGVHVTGGTTQLDENDASWAALLGVMGIQASDQNGLHLGFLVVPPGSDFVPENGDVDQNGEIDVNDINLLCQTIKDGAAGDIFDLNGDGNVDTADHRMLVEEILFTYIGDSNLDGEFNSGDFVQVFQGGEYEDDIEGNSTWATGDWNCDGDFNSGDFVLAFQAGGYEIGPREQAAAAVPEPGLLPWAAGLACLAFRRRKN